MKWVKRILLSFGIFLVLFVVAALTLPILFKKQILEAVKNAANEQLTAKIDFKDVSLSLLWTFPNFSFSMKELTITGKEEFEGLKLADVKDLSLRLNLWKVMGGTYEVNSVIFDKPNFYIKVLNNGKANYDIMKPDTTTKKPESETTSFSARLSYYAIKNADIIYDDSPNKTYVKMVNLTHTGSGNLTASTYDFFTKTNIDEFSMTYDMISYFTKTKVDIRLNIGVDINKMAFQLMDNSFKFNALELKAEGGIEMPGNDIKFNNLKFSAPTTTFASVLSLIPSAFTKDFAKVQTKGAFSLAGNVNGVYNDKSYPAFNLDLKVSNAEFKYPDLPLAVTNINTDLSVKSPSGDLDKMLLNVSKFTMKLGNNPFEAMLKLSTPMSDPNIDTKIKGKIDMAELAKAFPMEGVATLNGILEANLEAKTRMSYIEKQEYDKVDMKGLLSIAGFTYIAKGSPSLLIKKMKMDFTPNFVNLEECDIMIGKSDIKASGKLDNILTYFSGDKIMKGNLIVRSSLLDLNDMMKSTAGTETKTDTKAATNMVDTTTSTISGKDKIFDRWDFAADFECKKMLYDVYEIKDIAAKGSFAPSRAKLQKFEMLLGKVDIQAKGEIENVFGYLFDNQEIKGEINLSSNYMNLNQFMTETGQATEPAPQPTPSNPETVKSEYEPILVPANINFHVTGAFATLIYESYKLKNVKADIRIRDQRVEIIDMSCNAFGGSIALNGEYSSKNPEAPTFALGYDLKKLDFQEVAMGVPFISYMAPAMKSLFGRFSSQFKMNAVLGKNLYPKLNTINAEGLIETFDAALKGMTPMKGLSDKLKIKELENFVLTNTKNFFTIKDGAFGIKPFAFKHSGIDMTFGGSHGLDQKMNYNLKMRVPKALLDKAGIGQAASEGMKALNGQAQKLGIKVEEAEFLNIGVDIGGTTTKPTFTPKVLGAEGKSGQSLGDQVKESIKEEANKLKEEAEAKVKAEADKLKKEAEERARTEAERLSKELEAKAKAEADRMTKQIKDNAEVKRIRDSIEAATKAAKDKILKDKLKDIPNPFKKNK